MPIGPTALFRSTPNSGLYANVYFVAGGHNIAAAADTLPQPDTNITWYRKVAGNARQEVFLP